uniref:Uncharacterized protein n=1 Tax=Oryza brachyantha TaxID=4533 RepID=J3KUT5_ORYBR
MRLGPTSSLPSAAFSWLLLGAGDYDKKEKKERGDNALGLAGVMLGYATSSDLFWPSDWRWMDKSLSTRRGLGDGKDLPRHDDSDGEKKAMVQWREGDCVGAGDAKTALPLTAFLTTGAKRGMMRRFRSWHLTYTVCHDRVRYDGTGSSGVFLECNDDENPRGTSQGTQKDNVDYITIVLRNN